MSTNGPQIQFAVTTNDYGRVLEGEVVKREFFFTNAGTDALFILEIKSSCGCTTALGLGKVDPGQEGRIPVELFSSGMEGPFNESVTVSCNDPEKPHVKLHLKGTVWRPITVTPRNAAFGRKVDSPGGLTRVLQVKNQEKEPLVLSEPRTTHRQFSAQLRTIAEGKEYELTVRLVPPLGSGNVFGEVQMETSLKTMPLLKVPVWAISQGGVLVFPRGIALGPGPLPRAEVRTVSIQNNLTAALTLATPAVNTPGVEVQVVEEQPGQSFAVTLTFAEGYTVPAGGAELTIPCNQPGSPQIRVPIVAGSAEDGQR